LLLLCAFLICQSSQNNNGKANNRPFNANAGKVYHSRSCGYPVAGALNKIAWPGLVLPFGSITVKKILIKPKMY
jgi:hypothetical protein